MSTIFGRETGLFFSYDAIFERHDLSTLQKLVYIYFCRRTNSNRQSTPSYDSIAHDCGCHRSSAIEAVNELGRKGLVVKHRRKRHNGSDTSNMYIVFPPDSPFNSIDEDISDNGKAMPKKSSNLEGSSQATPGRVVQDDPRGVVSGDPQKDKRSVVVVGEGRPEKKASLEETAEDETGPEPDYTIKEIQEVARSNCSADLPAAYLAGLLEDYSAEYIKDKIKLIGTGAGQIRNLPGLLLSALRKDYGNIPGQPVFKERGPNNNNRTVWAGPRKGQERCPPDQGDEQSARKRELIKKLYLGSISKRGEQDNVW